MTHKASHHHTQASMRAAPCASSMRDGATEISLEEVERSSNLLAQVMYAQVLIPRPLKGLLTYRLIYQDTEDAPRLGECVWVPLGQREVIACIWGLLSEEEHLKERPQGRHKPCRDVTLRLTWLPTLPDSLRALIDQLARYYHVTRGEALNLALPSFDAQRGFLFTHPQEVRARQRAQEAERRAEREARDAQEPQLSLFSDHDEMPEIAPQLVEYDEDSPQHPLHRLIKYLQQVSVGGPLRSQALPFYVSRAEWAQLCEAGVLRELELPPRRDAESFLFRAISGSIWPVKRRERVERRVFEYLGHAEDHVGERWCSLSALKDAQLCADYPRLKRALRTLLDLDLIQMSIEGEVCESGSTAERPPQDHDAQDRESDERLPSVRQHRSPFVLTEEQNEAVHIVQETRGFQVYLLHGVTGSGKTEVYLRLIEEVLDRGAQALVLVPEIGLTPQTVRRFEERFSCPIYAWHSQLSSAERLGTWRAVAQAEPCVLIGARSALFAPLPHLALIIVDESHDGSYKQGDGVRYHARDMAIYRAAILGCPALLGSATPSLESMYNAQHGKYRLLQLTERPQGASLPHVRTVDLTTSRAVAPTAQALTNTLARAISERLKRREQVILFLNRRGFSQSVRCTCCGFLFSCPTCALTLSWHQHKSALCCHHCDFTAPIPTSCPTCHEQDAFAFLGKGTERIEEQLRSLFNQAKISRLDRDSELKPQALQEVMERDGVDILIGTQMVTKGHDFPRVTLVGVIDADVGLDLPDFRVNERSYQLLSQVAGRAGRATLAGEVIVQTYRPQEERLLAAITHDYGRFYLHELALRKTIGYPPFGYLATVRLQGEGHLDMTPLLAQLSDEINQAITQDTYVESRGPSPAPLNQLHGQQRWITLLRSQDRATLHRVLKRLRLRFGRKIGNARFIIDVDPHDFS